MSDNCLFCRIARHEIPAHIIHEDERLLAFLDIQPVRPGHVLVVGVVLLRDDAVSYTHLTLPTKA